MKKINDLLIADEDKIITNGKDYGTTISLAQGVSEEDYYEIPKSEYFKDISESDVIDE